MHPNKASPTIAIHSVIAVLGLVTARPWQIVVKIDIKEAFIQTPMQGELTYMKLDQNMTDHVVQKEIETDGCLYMLILRGLYG